MQQKFEEFGVSIDGKAVTLFNGAVEFDEAGTADQIWIDGYNGETLFLDHAKLLAERHRIQNDMSQYGRPLVELMRRNSEFFLKASLWQSLAPALEKHFAEEIEDMLADVEDGPEFDANVMEATP